MSNLSLSKLDKVEKIIDLLIKGTVEGKIKWETEDDFSLSAIIGKHRVSLYTTHDEQDKDNYYGVFRYMDKNKSILEPPNMVGDYFLDVYDYTQEKTILNEDMHLYINSNQFPILKKKLERLEATIILEEVDREVIDSFLDTLDTL